jgi:RsiW-degrading membrane proteinase PrsW (M82 family)
LGEGLRTLILERGQQENLMMRSVLFVVIWLVLAFWTMVGVTAPLPRGFMLGMGMHFIFDLLWDYRLKRGDLSFWFWQIKREVSLEEQRWFVIVVTFLGGLVILGL